MISRYFDPEKYANQGFQDAITLNSDITYAKGSKLVVIDKVISEEEVTFYNNIWLNTESIPLIANPTVLKNYKVEGVERREEPFAWDQEK